MPLTQISTSNLDTTNSLFFRNRIINGDMRIDQRNAGASITPTANGAYSTYRWAGYLSTSSKYSLQQVAVPSSLAGFTTAIKATSLSAYTPTGTNYFGIAQAIEGYTFSDLSFGTVNAKSVTISFWAYSSLTGNLGASLQNYNEDRCYSFNAAITNANTWTYCTVTIPGCTDGTWDTTNSGAAYLWFGLGAAGTRLGTAGSWTTTGGYNLQPTGSLNYVATSGATLYITGVQLEVGTAATAFERLPYTNQLQQCQRYFEKTYLQSEVPGANFDARDSASRTYSFGDSSGQSQPFVWNFKVSKRGAPTVNIYNPFNGTANQYRVLETGTNMSAQVIKNTSTETCTVASAGAGLSSNYRFDVHITAASEL